MYTPDVHAGRLHVGPAFDATSLTVPAERPLLWNARGYTEAASNYIAYSGPYYVDELNRSLTHEMHVSLFPNWLGHRQARLVQIGRDLLRLGTDTSMNFGGARKTAVLVWRRVEPNS